MTTAKKMKAEGVKAGVLDVFVPVARAVDITSLSDIVPRYGMKHGLYIEMKYGKNTMTENQKEFTDFVTVQGYLVKVCYTWIEAAKEIFNYLGLELPEGVG